MDDRTKAISFALIASLLFAFMGVFSKDFKSFDVNSYGVTEIRLLITAIGVGLVMLIFHRDQFRIRKEDVLLFLGLAIAKMLMDTTYFYSLQTDLDVTVALVLQMTMPFFVLGLSYFIFKEEITMRKKVALVVGIIGIVIAGNFLTGEFRGGLDSVILAIASGFFYAVYSVGGKVLADRDYSANTVLFYTFGIAAICIAPHAMENDLGSLVGAIKADPVWMVCDILLLGIICSLVPFYLLQKAREYADATTVAITSLSGIAFTAIVGFMLLDTSPSITEWIGIALLICSLVIMNATLPRLRKKWGRGRKRDEKPPA